MILLDTHVLVWLDTGSRRLGAKCHSLIDEAHREADICVSAISFWEATMLADRGRIDLSMPPSKWRQDLLAAGIRELPVDGDIGIAAARLDGFHGDPADRILAATAILQEAELFTADQKILAWPGALKRRDATQ